MSATEKEQEFYNRFRQAYEAHEQRVWELERLTIDLARVRRSGKTDPEKEKKADGATKSLTGELENIQRLITEAKTLFGPEKIFMGELIIPGEFGKTVQQRIGREALGEPDGAFRHTLLTALLNDFIERERQSRSSIYKKRFRGGFKDSAEKLIGEEKQKNEQYRSKLVEKYKIILTPEEITLLYDAFRRRMARHGEDMLQSGA